MKFQKEQIQKAVLVGMLGVGGLWYYAYEMMGPLAERRTKAEQEIASLEGKIKEAKTQITRGSTIEAGDTNAAAARGIYAAMRAKIPDGQPVAWLPTRLSDFFVRQGIAKPAFHCNIETAGMEFPGYKTSSWTIEIPGVGFATLGAALAGLENQEGLMQITSLQIDAMAKEPESSHAKLLISTLVKSEK